jgi:hypothetical protein
MGTYSGLSAFTDAVTPHDEKYVKANWAKFDAGKTVRVRFMSELDPDSKNYDEQRGTALLALEHESPSDFTRRALCTRADEGRCWACEQHAIDRDAGWYVKRRAYFNILVDNGKDDPTIGVWKMTVGPRATNTKMLLAYAAEEGGISSNWWSVTRTGTGQDTTYSLIPKAQDVEPFDWSAYEANDLSKTAVRRIPYAEQEAYFTGGRSSGSTKPDSGSTTNDIWL